MSQRSGKKKLDFEMQLNDAQKDLASRKFTETKEAAEAHGLAISTLRARLDGGVNRQTARALQQNWSIVEENALKRWILKLDDWGFPPRHQHVQDIALDFLQSHGITTPTLGKNWITRFLLRHPELACKFSYRLNKQRAFANNATILKDFFIEICDVVTPNNTIILII